MTTKFRLTLTTALASIGFSLAAQSVEQGVALMEKEDYRGARKVFNSLIAKAPNTQEPYFYLGETYYENDNLDSARYFYSKGVELAKGGLNHVGLAKLALDKKDAITEKKSAETAVKVAKQKDARVYYELGKAYYDSQNGNLDKSIEYLNKAIELNFKNPDYYAVRGDVYAKKGDTGKSISDYEFAIEKDKNNPKAYVKKAVQWKKARILDQAEETLQECLKLDPNYTPALKELIDVYYLAGKYQKMVPLLKQYSETVTSDIEARERYVRFLVGVARDYPTAITEGQKVLAVKPNSHSMSRCLGYSYFETGKYQESLDAMKKFFEVVGEKKVFDSDYDYYIKSAVKLNDYKTAMDKLEEAIKIYPEKNALWGDIAEAQFKAKDYKNAAVSYGYKMKTTDKPNTTDLYYLGQAQYFSGQYPTADSVFMKLNELSPKYVAGYQWRARCADKLDPEGTQGLAKPHYEKIIELAAADPAKNKKALVDSYTYMGYYNNAKSDVEGAKLYFAKVLEVDPSNARAAEILQQLGGTITTSAPIPPPTPTPTPKNK